MYGSLFGKKRKVIANDSQDRCACTGTYFWRNV
jgi:hypothetical protein